MPRVTDPYERQHLANLAKYGKLIDEIFRSATQEAAQIGTMVGTSNFDASRVFSFSDYPLTQRRVQSLLSRLANNVETAIVNGIDSEWTLANNKNSALSRRVFGDNVGRLTQAQYRRYFSTNDDARQAFLQRKEQGLNLSERVWRYAQGFKSDIELGLDVGIRTGLDASAMSRQLQQFLQHPDMLFRRVRDEHGNLVLSKRASDYHPGQGVYRSSYKNARRLAATEINMAYRTADYERMQQLDFVVGIEVCLSNNHPIHDICDDLCGRYPKDFKFTGWHPHCRCYVVQILKTEAELMAENRAILAGEEPSEDSVNRVDDVPQAFNDWVRDNEYRIKTARSIPYFMQDNGTISDGKFTLKDFKQGSHSNENTTPQLDHIAGLLEKVKKDEAVKIIKETLCCTTDEAEAYRKAVYDFTYGWDSAIRKYQQGETSGFIISKQGKKVSIDIEKVKERSELIEDFIKKSPKWKGSETYRGIQVTQDVLTNIISQLKQGEGNMLGMSSWSTAERCAKNFATDSIPNGYERVVFVCKKQKYATSIQHLSQFGAQEEEVLASQKSRYKLIKVEKKMLPRDPMIKSTFPGVELVRYIYIEIEAV